MSDQKKWVMAKCWKCEETGSHGACPWCGGTGVQFPERFATMKPGDVLLSKDGYSCTYLRSEGDIHFFRQKTEEFILTTYSLVNSAWYIGPRQ